MATTTTGDAAARQGFDRRVLEEGYGGEAWHGPELKSALADVTPQTAFRRPSEGRHNIAEIALHHAYCVHAVRGQLTGTAEPFVLAGDDWFPLDNEQTITWANIQATVAGEHRRLADAVDRIEAGSTESPLSATERFNLVLGITCHAVYHAGQVQLIKRLIEA
jgi:hypothetical protein